MSETMDPTFADGLRASLIRYADATPRRRSAARRRWGIGAVLVVGLLGGGTAYAAHVWVQPGGEEHAELATPVRLSSSGTATIALGPRPDGASQVFLEFTPYDPGTYSFGRGGAGLTVGAADLPGSESASSVNRAATSYYLRREELDPGGTSFTITTSSASLRWTATLTWVSSHTTAWGVNASGQTYGVQNETGTPDLIAVVATNGREGYVYRIRLEDADGTTASRSFRSPEDALAWQREHAGTVTHLPVFASDGRTRVGEFDVG
ncbi:peptidase M56 family protein [Leifsonia shinshuensis]|uniref:peptidase M56 family protein n=1 Tax=Leifsonia shinshuensis TaxID=150026 RepID=UPI001F50DA3E|nr:peptidase M56 family protein [Leifsonia shinshuensis]MCI0158822.1 peptidase M56 family protein [Leifsonia shinshuensis]